MSSTETFLDNYLPFSEKYIPKTFLECNHSPRTSKLLMSISNNKNLKEGLLNIALYGPSGSGKYTRLLVTLNNYLGHKSNIYRTSVKAIDVETGSFVPLPCSKSKVKHKVIYALVSRAHCEIELGQANSDKALIPFLDYYSRSKNIYLNIQKYVILRNVEILKKETQNALRRIVETCQSKIRFMLTINSLSRLISPLRSRFLCVSVKPPTKQEATDIINKIAKEEKFTISSRKIDSIIEKSYSGPLKTINLRELFLTLEGSLIMSRKNKISKIYTSEKNEASDLLVKAVKKGNRDEIRNLVYKVYELMKDDFENIITCDFFRKMSEHIKDNDKMKFISVTSDWNAKINQNYILQPILQAEAYMFSVCELYGV
jgi:replication factor C subunit 3/5